MLLILGLFKFDFSCTSWLVVDLVYDFYGRDAQVDSMESFFFFLIIIVYKILDMSFFFRLLLG